MTRRGIGRLRDRSERSGNGWAGGLVLVFLGLFFFLQSLFGGLPGLTRLWPLILVLAGGGSFLAALLGSGARRAERIVTSVTAIGVGFFLLAITLGPLEWASLRVLWPVFPGIAGIASIWGWLASGGRSRSHLASATIGLTVCVVGLLFTTTPLAAVLASIGWPLILVAVGILLLLREGVRAVTGRRTARLWE